MRDSRFGDAKLLGEVTDAQLGSRERVENADPRRIAEHAEDFGKAVHGLGVELRHI
jgi:hypothetical protein